MSVGTAAWAIPRDSAEAFTATGSVLERYAGVFNAVEINSTFYRAHRPATFARWAACVPPDFRFAVKIPKAITHEARLRDCDAEILAFVDQIGGLGGKLGPLLLQLPPSYAFDANRVETACALLRRAPGAKVACEPRHPTWFTPEVDRWLAERAVARVAADPARGPHGGRPGGWNGLAYYRLHGSPRVYYSPYSPEQIAALTSRLTDDPARETWCIFDNTALGRATADALALRRALAGALAST